MFRRPILRFAMVVGATVVVLFTLNLLPAFLGGEPLGVVRYSSPEAVEAEYGVQLWRPASMPERFPWPPTIVRVAIDQPRWVQFVFNAAGGDAFVVCQTLGGALAAGSAAHGEVSSRLIEAGEVLEANDITIEGRPVRMRRLLLAEGIIVHDVWWKWGATSVMLRMRGTAEDLTRAARVAIGNRS